MWLLPDPLHTILFDAGGTLVRLDYEHMAALAAERDIPLDPAALPRAEAGARRRLDAFATQAGRVPGTDAERIPPYFEMLLEAAEVHSPARVSLAAAIASAHADDNLWRVPTEGVHETLAALGARGVRTAVVSNADGRVRRILETLGLAAHVEFVIDSREEGVEKPDAEIFRRALARLGVEAAGAVYVGDIYSIDVVGARAGGLVPCLVDPTDGYPDADCARIVRLAELLDHVPTPE